MTNRTRAFLGAVTSSLILLSLCIQDGDAYPACRRVVRNPVRCNYYGVNNRQIRQQSRIAQGATTGRLTATEYSNLQRREASLTAQEARYRSTNGLQPWERQRLDNRQDHLNNSIYKQKHDAQRIPVTTTTAM